MSETMTGAEMVIRALQDQGVEHIFGYPGGAVLPIYDAIFQQDKVKHILVRHEQGAVHAAEGYARSSGKVGCVLVTSGPGATNAVTGLTDALLDSIPIVCFTGQVPTHLIGSDAFQECDTVGITRHCTKHNYLVKRIEDLPRIIHEAFYVASNGRPGPVVIDIPKDIQFATGAYERPGDNRAQDLSPEGQRRPTRSRRAVELMARPSARSSTPAAASSTPARRRAVLLRELVRATGYPITSTLMGLGAYPASDPQWLGMLGMHGTYEANMAMHDCDVMICIGARFDDRITGRLDAFSPKSKKIHVDIDASSINKNVKVDLPIVGDCAAMCWPRWCACGRRRSRSRQGRAQGVVGADFQVAGAQLPRLQALGQRDQAAIRDRAALCADQGSRHLHHHRSRPAPDVGGAVSCISRSRTAG
jgi:acetolactate synthase-1/2/3 large subunit